MENDQKYNFLYDISHTDVRCHHDPLMLRHLETVYLMKNQHFTEYVGFFYLVFKIFVTVLIECANYNVASSLLPISRWYSTIGEFTLVNVCAGISV